MNQETAIKIFESRQVRTIWNEEEEEWYFSVVDVVEILTDSPNPRKYWSVLKTRLKKEGNETATNCSQLKLLMPDGKMRFTDVANAEQLFRLIQSIPSPKAKPFKQVKMPHRAESPLINSVGQRPVMFGRLYSADI